MRVFYADLEREWRGGQSQALLTLRGLGERGHEVELLAARDSPLANRVLEAGITVHQVPRFGKDPVIPRPTLVVDDEDPCVENLGCSRHAQFDRPRTISGCSS